MALRKTAPTADPQSEPAPEPKVNPEVDQKINEYIKANPKQFEYYNSLPKERLVRVAILKDVQAKERSERTKSAILRKLDSDPEMKKSVETLVRNLPEDKKQTAMANIASRTFRMEARSAKQTSRPGGNSLSAGG